MTLQSKDDELFLKKALSTAGFGAQVRFRTLLTPPEGSRKDHSWDFFQDGRLAFLYPSIEKATTDELGPNLFLSKSELCYTQCVQGSIPLKAVSEMLSVSETDTWFSPSGKAAQRGPAWFEAVLSSLLYSPAADDLQKTPWVTVHDHVDILDIHPHLGDAALTTNAVISNPKVPCSLRHFIVQMGYKTMEESAEFTCKRLQQTLEIDWCKAKSPLYDFEEARNGKCVMKPVYPRATVFVPESYQLQAIPGCYEAYQGLGKLQLQVCRVTSTGHIKINPEKAQEFTGAGDLIKRKAKALEEYHAKEIENLLIHMMSNRETDLDGIDDPRHIEDVDKDSKDGALDGQAKTFASVEELKSEVDIQVEAKMHSMHTVKMLRDSTLQVWGLATKDTTTVPKGSILGAYGSGKVREVPPESLIDGRHVPFCLPLGDRTPIILCKNTGKEDADEDIGSKAPETLYKTVKALMKSNQGAHVKLAGMGTLKPQTQGAGKHGYEVEFPEGHEKYVPCAFELQAQAGAGKKTTSGNFFVPLANPNGLEGAMDHCWKCSHKPVHAKMKPEKPFVITTKTLTLVKGQPTLLGGPAKPAAEEAG